MNEPALTRGEDLRRQLPQFKFERRKLPTLIAEHITQMILEGGLEPGVRLRPEHEMLEEFGVGRGTLREALRLLEAEGLISIRTGPGGGPVVERPDARRLTRIVLIVLLTSGATLRHVYEARGVLDPLIASLAAENATPEQRQKLGDSVTSMEEQIDDEDAFLAENGQFHRLLAESCGNPALYAFALTMLDILDGYSIGIRYSIRSRRGVVDIHHKILDAVVEGDAEAAGEYTAVHMAEAVRYFMRKYPGEIDKRLRPAPHRGQTS